MTEQLPGRQFIFLTRTKTLTDDNWLTVMAVNAQNIYQNFKSVYRLKTYKLVTAN